MMMKVTGRTQDKRLWLGGGAVLAVLIVVSAASATRDQAAANGLQNQALRERNATLKEQNDDTGALQASLTAALAQLPSDGGLPAFTRQLSAQATAASVVLTSVVVGAATPVVQAAGQAASGPSATAPGAAPAPASTTGETVPANSTGLVQMAITVAATGLGRHDLAFLRAIQWSGPRRALVTAVQLAPAGGSAGSNSVGSSSATGGSAGSNSAAGGIDGPCTLTLTLTIFSAPLSPPAKAALEKLLSGN